MRFQLWKTLHPRCPSFQVLSKLAFFSSKASVNFWHRCHGDPTSKTLSFMLQSISLAHDSFSKLSTCSSCAFNKSQAAFQQFHILNHLNYCTLMTGVLQKINLLMASIITICLLIISRNLPECFLLDKNQMSLQYFMPLKPMQNSFPIIKKKSRLCIPIMVVDIKH